VGYQMAMHRNIDEQVKNIKNLFVNVQMLSRPNYSKQHSNT